VFQSLLNRCSSHSPQYASQYIINIPAVLFVGASVGGASPVPTARSSALSALSPRHIAVLPTIGCVQKSGQPFLPLRLSSLSMARIGSDLKPRGCARRIMPICFRYQLIVLFFTRHGCERCATAPLIGSLASLGIMRFTLAPSLVKGL
jgi:hypothetical protein